MTRYAVDPDRSEVTVYASSSLHGITGHADGLRGWVDVDGTTITGARIELDAERLAWGNPLLDRETRRRIDADRHPTIVGAMTAADSNTNGSMDLSGTITFHGVEREVRGTVTITSTDPDGDADADGLVIEGEQTFDVRDWDLEPPRLLMLKVDPDIRVAIRVHVVR